MPAPVHSVNTRATRSRYSSPQLTPNGHGNGESGKAAPGSGSGAAVDAQRSFLQRWLEPPVQIKASFQDAGLVRHGVVENMAPLGTMPKAGTFKMTAHAAPSPAAPVAHPAALEQVRPPTKKIILKRPAPSTPTPAPVVAPAAPEEDETEEEEYHSTDAGEEYDGEGTPAPVSGLSRRSLASRGGDRDEEWATSKPSPSYKSASGRSMSRASIGNYAPIGSLPHAGSGNTSRFSEGRELCDRAVESAVDEALANFRYPTAWALRTLYDENFENDKIINMVERVFNQTADQDTLREFAKLISEKKKEGKKGNKGYYYFEGDEPNGRGTPRPPNPAPYGSLVKFDTSVLHLGVEHKPQPEPEQDTEPEVKPEPEREAQQVSEPLPEPLPEREPESEPAPESEREPEPEEEAKAEPEPQLQSEPPPPPQSETEPKPEPEPQPDREVHARKKRRSTRRPNSASKMALNGVNGKPKTDSPSRRRTRARSVSSSSSLSSARSLTPPVGIKEGDEDGETDQGDIFSVPPSRASPAAERERKRAHSNNAAAPQPITKRRRRSNAPRKNGNVSPSNPPPTSPTTQPSSTAQDSTTAQPPPHEQPYDMPAVLDAPQFPNQGSKKGSRSTNNGVVFPSKVGKLDENDPKVRLRQKAQKVTNRFTTETPAKVSNVRESQSREFDLPRLDFEEATAVAPPSRPRTAQAAVRATPTAPNARSTRSSRKRSHDELEEQASPTTLNFASEVPSTAANSRAGTPVLRAAKKPRTGLRVKTSPMKKKGGTLAGIPRASGERNSPVGNGGMAKEDDNDDYCSSCGGNGELICCDGCTRSFHFNCVDPPLVKDSMPVEWFCNVCRSARSPPGLPSHTGAFAALLERLDARNSSAFNLPADIRNYFEGVRTNADGEYEEIVAVIKPGRKKKSDEDQVPDFFRLRDAEGNAVICHNCHKSAEENRAIIPCSLCGLFWHLECLDPPLANPPVLRTWRCPCHVDDLLAKVPGALGPAHRFRKIKGAPVIKPAFSRGYVNNGYVEVDLDRSDEDESGWKNADSFGRIVRLPERGIKSDFLSHARVNRKGKPIPPLSDTIVQPPLDMRSLEEQQAAYNLAQLSGSGNSTVASLVDALLAEADPTIIALMARGNKKHLESGKLNGMDQQSLRAMLSQMEEMSGRIRRMLAPATPERLTSPQAAISITDSGSTARDLGARVPSLTNSQTTDAESENPQQPPVAPQHLQTKSNGKKDLDLPSPAATELPTINGDGDDLLNERKVSASGEVVNGGPRVKEEENPAAAKGVALAVDGIDDDDDNVIIMDSRPVVSRANSTSAVEMVDAENVMDLD
ncbi:hypothetical protein B0H66DRAFT_192771 [Apodospora peruviana]|uniref:PHD-type domain-containing protein n=1 Tax=Apodospora peruviana TaxID=516989 RepID=A0AAE0IBM8_9PEZI|nr:hypothetical protein B0H66DRAFT_192771 [Apodospora peruviana]